MKRYIMCLPFIVDMRDTRLPKGKTMVFPFEFSRQGKKPPERLEVTVTYHLLDEKRRKRIGYETDPVAALIGLRRRRLSSL